MSGARKGSSFERHVSKQLSLWWSQGIRTDIFWRSSQSGGRATQRSKKGLRTYGSYGDIAAIDPIGEPLLKLFTIELKCGRAHGSPWDMFDGLGKKHPFQACLEQAMDASENAGSKTWLLIVKRDRRHAIVYLEMWAARELGIKNVPRAWFGLEGLRFVALRFDTFLEIVPPSKIIELIGS
jgi:hypothetical protein